MDTRNTDKDQVSREITALFLALFLNSYVFVNDGREVQNYDVCEKQYTPIVTVK